MFKVGQKIVCIKPVDNLELNEIYTISLIEDDACRVLELEHEDPEEGYYLFRFRPLDYKFSDSVLKRIEQEVKEGRLVFV